MQNKVQMQHFVVALLNEHLPSYYYYHNFEHTWYVQQKAVQIAQYEYCTEDEIELLSAAALWHDTGYIHTNARHEQESCLLAKKYLPEYGFTVTEIEIICGMIMATKLPQAPKNKLEEILVDADLAYLGDAGAKEKADLLFKELQSLNAALTKEEWNKTQIDFLSSHHFFTRYCKQVMEPVKQAYLNKLIETN